MTAMRAIIIWSISVMLVSLASEPVRGQHAMGDGRALDNNLQQGAGKHNQPAGEANYLLRNALITGNVPGLGFFHDDVDYRAPGEFISGFEGDSEGTTDDLFSFNSRSLSVGYSAIREGPLDLNGYGSRGAPPILYRSNTGPSSADFYFGTGNYWLVEQRDATYRAHGLPAVPRDALRQPTLTTDQILDAMEGQNRQYFSLPIAPNLDARFREQLGEVEEPAHDDEITETPSRAGIIRESIRAPGDEPSFAPTSDLPVDATSGGVPLDLPPAVEIGSLLQHQQQLERVGADPSRSLEERIAQIETRMFDPLGETTAPIGEDVYLGLLSRIRGQRTSSAQQGQETHTSEQPTSIEVELGIEAELEAALQTEQQTDLRPVLDPDRALLPDLVALDSDPLRLEVLEPPSTEQLEAARAKRAQAIRSFLGLDPEPAEEEETEDNSASIEDEEAEEETEDPLLLDEMLNELLEILDYDLAGLATLASDKSSEVEQLMRKAEAQMAEGLYIDADFTYRRVLNVESDHVLGRVGLIHAQLGGGMIRSAAFNLRILFEHHPEMIAARYGPAVMPSSERIVWIRKQLDKIIDLTTRAEPAVVLAYLGYQTRSAELVTYGLDVAQTRRPKDPLIALLRGIWVDGEDGSNKLTDPAEQDPQK